MSFYQVKVQFTVEDEKTGKLKKQKINYLTEAMSVVEADAKIVKHLTDDGEKAFEVVSVSESSISSVVI